MKKSYSWDLKVNGTRHQLECLDRGTNLEVYVDDAYRFSIRMDMNQNQEHLVTVGGKTCRLVVEEGIVDLEVDGILLNAEAELLEKERKDRNFSIFLGVLMTLVGTIAVFFSMSLILTGQTFFGSWFGVPMAFVFTILGVWQIIRALRK